jgi:c-di-AMP phosphodiesterase-like protein
MSRVKTAGALNKYLHLPLVLTAVFILINAGVYLLNTRAGILVSGGLVIYIILILVIYGRQRENMLNDLVTFATQYGQVQRKLMMDLALPYAITDDRGKLLWFNDAFAELTGKDRKSFRKSIASIFNGMSPDKFPARDQEIEYETVYNRRDFRIQIKSIVLDDLIDNSQILERDDQEESSMLYAFLLFDETELNNYIQKYEDETMVCGMIYMDNYDEAMESVDEVRRSLLTALVDRKINKYFQDLDGIVKKFDKDKYLIAMRTRTLNELKGLRFNILDDVKTVNIGNDMAVTLSIGIGANNGSYNRNFECARMAIDLALGRGGDQVVLRDGDSITYFGGKSQAVEKSTRVKARVKAHALQEFIESSDKVVIMGHKMMDIDAFGSAIGIYRASRTLNKRAYIVVDSPTITTKPFIDEFENNPDYDSKMLLDVHEAKEMVDDKTLLVVVDTNKPDYTECEELLHRTGTIVVLDHHRQGNNYIRNAVLSYIEPYASSACEMVAEILQYFAEGVKLKSIEADALYAGIMIDTDNFMSKTGVRTFEACAYLRRGGADVTRVRKMFRENVDDYRAKGETLSNAEMYRDHFIISVCPSGNLESPTIVGSQAANQLLNIKGVKASFVLTEYKNVIYISARAIDEVNVQIIMERMGGGGHLNMAGAQLPKVSVEEAVRRLKRVLDATIEGGDLE